MGAVVVSKDLAGNVSLEQTDHTVGESAIGLGGVGFVVGLFAPPLLAATAIGAALGAAGGKALHKKIGSEVEKMAERTIPIGGAGLIVAYPRSAGEKVEPAVTRAMQKVIGEAEGHHVKALKGALEPTLRRKWPRRTHKEATSRSGLRSMAQEDATPLGDDGLTGWVRVTLHPRWLRRRQPSRRQSSISSQTACSSCSSQSVPGRAMAQLVHVPVGRAGVVLTLTRTTMPGVSSTGEFSGAVVMPQ